MGRGSDSADDEAPKPALPTLDSGDLTWAKRDEELLRQGFGRDHAPPQVAHVPVLVLLDWYDGPLSGVAGSSNDPTGSKPIHTTLQSTPRDAGCSSFR
jgi:hypothetical protein